jgi:release factor glutamine methyltransferase
VAATVAELLVAGTRRLAASGSETPRLDAELLLGYVLGIDRTGVLAHPEAVVGDGQQATWQVLLERRAMGEPVAYLREFKEFRGLAFRVDPRVLIPRPETERLVDLAEDRVRTVLTGAPRAVDASPLRIWDVGTGSGAIAVALAVALRKGRFLDEVRLTASDVSPDALNVAVENAVAHGVADRIDFLTGDLLDVDPPAAPTDLLLANLPYIPSAIVPTLPVAASFEPPNALDGGTDGLDLIRRLLTGAPGVLDPGGLVLLEIGSDQVEAATSAVEDALPGWSSVVHADLGGQPRVLAVTPPDGWLP